MSEVIPSDSLSHTLFSFCQTKACVQCVVHVAGPVKSDSTAIHFTRRLSIDLWVLPEICIENTTCLFLSDMN